MRAKKLKRTTTTRNNGRERSGAKIISVLPGCGFGSGGKVRERGERLLPGALLERDCVSRVSKVRVADRQKRRELKSWRESRPKHQVPCRPRNWATQLEAKRLELDYRVPSSEFLRGKISRPAHDHLLSQLPSTLERTSAGDTCQTAFHFAD